MEADERKPAGWGLGRLNDWIIPAYVLERSLSFLPEGPVMTF